MTLYQFFRDTHESLTLLSEAGRGRVQHNRVGIVVTHVQSGQGSCFWPNDSHCLGYLMVRKYNSRNQCSSAKTTVVGCQGHTRQANFRG